MSKKILCFFIAIFINHMTYAEEYSYQDALNKYYKLNLSQPTTENDGRIQTLNKKGAMAPQLDEITDEFIKFSENHTVLEIGGAYGKIMIETLKRSPKVIYHLNDLDERHLFIAAHNFETAKLDQSTSNQVKFISGDITKKLTTQTKYDSILIARVLHFFSPNQLEQVIANIYNLLKPKGKVYIIAMTHYVKRYESFIPEYEKRLLNKEPFPGYVEPLKNWGNTEVTNSNQIASMTDEPFMFLDEEVLSTSFKKHHFKIIKCKKVELTYQSKSWSLDGRENVVIVAEKL